MSQELEFHRIDYELNRFNEFDKQQKFNLTYMSYYEHLFDFKNSVTQMYVMLEKDHNLFTELIQFPWPVFNSVIIWTCRNDNFNRLISTFLQKTYPDSSNWFTLWSYNAGKCKLWDFVDSILYIKEKLTVGVELNNFTLDLSSFLKIISTFPHLDAIGFSKCKFSKEFDSIFTISAETEYKVESINFSKCVDLNFSKFWKIINWLSANQSLKEKLQEINIAKTSLCKKVNTLTEILKNHGFVSCKLITKFNEK